MKIAISGTSGIGKTTLAKMLAESRGLPLIDEGFDGKITRKKSKPVHVWRSEFTLVMREKEAQEAKYSEFVTDRCPLDLCISWFNNELHKLCSKEQTDHFVKDCVRSLRRYNFIVIPPWGVLPFRQLEPGREGIRRNNNQFVLMRSQATMIGFAHMMLAKHKIIEIPPKIKSREQRVIYVNDQIELRMKAFVARSG